MRPYAPVPNTMPTFQDLWFQAYVAALHRVEPVAASMIAEEAVRVAHEHWKVSPTVDCWDYQHNYPVGHRFKTETPDSPSK